MRFQGVGFSLPVLAMCAVAATVSPVGSASSDGAETQVVRFTCDQGQKITATYLTYAKSVYFVVLRWNGRDYGLAEAMAASGSRYAALYGQTPEDAGLEWWEHQGIATLSRFTGKDFSDTQPVLSNCRAR